MAWTGDRVYDLEQRVDKLERMMRMASETIGEQKDTIRELMRQIDTLKYGPSTWERLGAKYVYFMGEVENRNPPVKRKFRDG